MSEYASPVAWLALLAWPAIVVAVFAAQRHRASLARTTTWMLVLPVMFLPVKLYLKVPGFSGFAGFDKDSLAVLSVALAIALFHRRGMTQTLRSHLFPTLVLLVFFVGTVETMRTNPEAITYGPTVLPGMGWPDVRGIMAEVILLYFVPFVIGERVYRTERDLRDLLDVLTRCGFIYLPFCLFEIRFSPQLHYWIYGYYQHEFGQMMRADGFRPMVFMNHGLSVAFFYFVCSVAAAGLRLARVPGGKPFSYRAGAWVLAGMTLLCKSLGSILYLAAVTVIRRVVRGRGLALIVALLAVLVVAYPVFRASPSFPRAQVISFFNGLSPDRASSLLFRFDNEEQLLQRARERPVFGWGGWGRNLIYAPWGGRVSIADGQWIILLGSMGYVGFGAFFSLLLVPVLRGARALRRLPARSQALLGTVTVILVIAALDQIPNSLSDPLPLVYAGALMTLASRLPREVAARHRAARRAPAPGPRPAGGSIPVAARTQYGS